MALTTYAELQTGVANWLSRVDLTSRIPEYIAMAEAKFQRTLRLRQMEERVSATAAQWLELPTDYLEMRNLKLTSTTPYTALHLIEPGDADARFSDATGKPAYYTLQGNQLRLVPAPDSTYTIEIGYFKKIPVLSDSNTSNWLLALASDVYLYGSVLEALIAVQDDERAATVSGVLAKCIAELYRQEREQRWSGSTMKTRIDGPTP